MDRHAILRWLPMLILDMGVPDTEEMREIIEVIRDSIDAGPAVYIHCWGGIGRTGTVVGCWLRETGLGGEESLGRVQHLYATHMAKVSRHPESPQTVAQKNFIRCWKSVADKGINL